MTMTRREGMVILFIITGMQCVGALQNCTSDTLKPNEEKESVIKPTLERHDVALLMILGYGGFAIFLAVVHKTIRMKVFHDNHNLDTVFDAGGRVTLSLTAVTVTSQMLWPADFLQGATTSLRTGISGPLYYGSGVILAIMIFPLLSVFLKIRAPGAKTFLQIVYARFGKGAHITFCCVALFVNILILTFLTLAGKAALEVLAKDVSYEFIALVLAIIFGSYCFIGGLGTTFYISYFNTALTLATVVVYSVFLSYTDNTDSMSFATHERIYEAMSCVKGPEGNYGGSLLTFRSKSGIIVAVIMFCFTTSLNFCDQANWQSRVAAKPAQGVLGFFIAAFLWFGIPTSVSMMSAMTYVSMSFENQTHLLKDTEIDAGFITPFIMERLMGPAGAYLLITMVSMALMSTGSGEVMGISSIIVYDIYKTYVNPFRKGDMRLRCKLCGKSKSFPGNKQEVIHLCQCEMAEDCKHCADDIIRRATEPSWAIIYKCPTHGEYRRYEDLLLHYKSWCIVWVTIAIVPYALIILSSGVDLNWAFFTLQTLLSPFTVPLLLTIAWSKSTAKGVVAGVIVGVIATVAGILIVAETAYDRGLSNFLVNTVADYSLLGGTISGLLVSTLVTVVVSLRTNNIRSEADVEREWQKTLDIDNPLHSWKTLYKDELQCVPDRNHIRSEDMNKVFRRSKLIAFIGGALAMSVFIIIIPASVNSIEVLSLDQFNGWITFCQTVSMVAAAFAIFVPPIQEVVQIVRELKSTNYNDLKKNTELKTKKTKC